jgi:hypothetical protein
MGDLDVVAKDFVLADLQALNVEPLPFSAFQVGDPILGMAALMHQFIQLSAKTAVDDTGGR